MVLRIDKGHWQTKRFMRSRKSFWISYWYHSNRKHRINGALEYAIYSKNTLRKTFTRNGITVSNFFISCFSRTQVYSYKTSLWLKEAILICIIWKKTYKNRKIMTRVLNNKSKIHNKSKRKGRKIYLTKTTSIKW